MFSIHPILSILSFWYPLLLSAKAIQKPNRNIQFLLLYWISYIAISNTQYFLLELNIIPFKAWVLVLGDLIELWLFYSHGCLVLAYYYLPKFLKQNDKKSLIETIDHKFIDPFVAAFVVRNVILQNFLRLISVRISPIDDLIHFNRELCKHYSLKQRRLSFLAFSLEYFCYIDSPTELHSRYLKSEKLIRDLSSSVSRAAAASAQKTSGFLETPVSFESVSSDSIVCDSFDDIIYTPRGSRNITPKDVPSLTEPAYPNHASTRLHPKSDSPDNGPTQALPKVRSLGQMEAGRKKCLPRAPGMGDRLEPPYPLRSGSG